MRHLSPARLISGTLVDKQPPQLMVDVGGVAYELEAPMTAFYTLPPIGEKVALYTHLAIREDAHLLYGFSDARQRDLFRTLLKVSGVGPRVGLAILSGLTVDELVGCVSVGDLAQLTRVPGIGRKTAERLLIELRDRLKTAPSEQATSSSAKTPIQDAISALMTLGYKESDASRAVRSIESAEGSAVEALIKEALRVLAKGSA